MDDRKKIYDFLKNLEGVTDIETLAKNLGWNRQHLIDVMCSVSSEFKLFNAMNYDEYLMGGDEYLKEYYQMDIVDLALLQETKLAELNSRPKFNTPNYQKYIKKYYELRGY